MGIKILQINAVGQTSSTGRTCRELAEYINNNTENVCYTAFADGNLNEFSFRIGNKFDHKVHSLFSHLTGKQAYFSKLATKRLIKFIKNKNIDIVILRNLHANYIHLPLLLKYLAKNDIATIVVLHDCWFFTGKCTHYTIDECYRWKTGCHDCPKLKRDNVSWFVDKTKQMWQDKRMLLQTIPRLGVIGVSDWITNEAKQSFLGKAKIIRRIYNWIDLDVFFPKDTASEWKKKLYIEDKKVVLGVASAWSRRKGLNDFIELASRLSDDYRIVLVGNMAKDVKLPNNITVVSSTNSVEELANLYNMADVFVTFSLEETFGKVSAEALACGTPIVCYDSTANKELVGEGCGQVVEPCDMEAVIQGVEKICKNGKEYYKKNCRDFALKMFDKETNIKQQMLLIDDFS